MRVYCEGEVTAQTDASESTCVLMGVNRFCFCSGQWTKLMSDFFLGKLICCLNICNLRSDSSNLKSFLAVRYYQVNILTLESGGGNLRWTQGLGQGVKRLLLEPSDRAGRGRQRPVGRKFVAPSQALIWSTATRQASSTVTRLRGCGQAHFCMWKALSSILHIVCFPSTAGALPLYRQVCLH